jgi:hypothetical protein
VTTFDDMMEACLSSLYEGERNKISVQLLCRIVRICADTVTPPDPNEGPPALQHIKAWSARIRDVVWRPDTNRFAHIVTIESDLAVGLMRIGFDDATAYWYSSDDVVEIPVHRALAHEWNERHRANSAGATPVTDS